MIRVRRDKGFDTFDQGGSVTLEVHGSISALALEWDELADRTGAMPFMRPGWVGAWWEAYGAGALEILAIRRSGRLVGLLPLRRRAATLSSPTNEHTPAFAPLVDDDQAASDLGVALAERKRAWMLLRYVDAGSPALQACLEPIRARGFRLLTRIIDRSPYIQLDGDVSDFERRLTSKRRSNLRRVRRRLESRGELALQVVDGTERLDEFLAEGLRLEGAAWKEAHGSSILSRPETRRFYAEVARWAADHGLLRLAFLRLDEVPLAFDYCLEGRNAHYLLKTGYDPGHRSDAPGMLMRYEMIRRAYALGLDQYEFLGSDQPWKLEWTDVCHDRALVRAYPPNASGIAAWMARSYAAPLAKKARELGRR
jgi:CelD/BcsL family acetyltransferase involved in cellulose biosynthesis